MIEPIFLGKPYSYWLELQRHADSMNYTSLIEDNARLRQRVNQLESTGEVKYTVSLPEENKKLILEISYK